MQLQLFNRAQHNTTTQRTHNTLAIHMPKLRSKPDVSSPDQSSRKRIREDILQAAQTSPPPSPPARRRKTSQPKRKSSKSVQEDTSSSSEGGRKSSSKKKEKESVTSAANDRAEQLAKSVLEAQAQTIKDLSLAVFKVPFVHFSSHHVRVRKQLCKKLTKPSLSSAIC